MSPRRISPASSALLAELTSDPLPAHSRNSWPAEWLSVFSNCWRFDLYNVHVLYNLRQTSLSSDTRAGRHKGCTQHTWRVHIDSTTYSKQRRSYLHAELTQLVVPGLRSLAPLILNALFVRRTYCNCSAIRRCGRWPEHKGERCMHKQQCAAQ